MKMKGVVSLPLLSLPAATLIWLLAGEHHHHHHLWFERTPWSTILFTTKIHALAPEPTYLLACTLPLLFCLA